MRGGKKADFPPQSPGRGGKIDDRSSALPASCMAAPRLEIGLPPFGILLRPSVQSMSFYFGLLYQSLRPVIAKEGLCGICTSVLILVKNDFSSNRILIYIRTEHAIKLT